MSIQTNFASVVIWGIYSVEYVQLPTYDCRNPDKNCYSCFSTDLMFYPWFLLSSYHKIIFGYV